MSFRGGRVGEFVALVTVWLPRKLKERKFQI